MADPLSVSVSAIQLLGASTSTAKALYNLIREWRRAPLELLRLSNEVNDLNLVLSHVEHTCSEFENIATDSKSQVEFSRTLTVMLEQMKCHVYVLDNLLSTMFAGPAREATEARKLGWLLKKNKVKRITSRIKAIKGDMGLLLTSQAT